MVRGRLAIRARRPHGYAFIELLCATVLFATLTGLAIPPLLSGLDRSRAWSAARYLAGRMMAARSQAVMRSAHVALQFRQEGADTSFQMFVDGDADGVRTRDIDGRIDTAVGATVRLSDLFPGVVIGASGAAGTDPVRIGTSNLLSFTPLGTATPGTIYIRGRDGTQLAVRVLGATARARVLRFVPATGEWVESF